MINAASEQPQEADGQEVIVLLTLKFREGTRDRVWQTMRPAIIATRAEEGNLEYMFFEVLEASDEYTVIERWRNQAALDLHLKKSHMESVLELFADALAFSMEEIPEHRTYLQEVR